MYCGNMFELWNIFIQFKCFKDPNVQMWAVDPQEKQGLLDWSINFNGM